MQLVSSPADIESLSQFVQDVTSWSPVPSGSLLRVPSYAYSNWGIQLKNNDQKDDNRLWLYQKSIEGYMCEWGETDARLNQLVADASQKAGLSDVNALMNAELGQWIVRHIAATFPPESIYLNREITIVDVGAGDGATSAAIAKQLEESGFRGRISFHLIEPSASRLGAAQERLSNLRKDTLNIFYLTETYQDRDAPSFVEMMRRQIKADVVVANASLHHNAFNFHLHYLNHILAPDGALFIGDWHHGLWETPARTFYMLQVLAGADVNRILRFVEHGTWKNDLYVSQRKEISQFRDYFELNSDQIRHAFSGLESSERQAIAGIMRFWKAVGDEFRGKQIDGQDVKSPIKFLEAHEPVLTRLDHLHHAGFKPYVPTGIALPTYPKSMIDNRGAGNLASVMALQKR